MTVVMPADVPLLQRLLQQRDRLNHAIAAEIRRGQMHGRGVATGSVRRVRTRAEWSAQLAAAAAIHYDIPVDVMRSRCRDTEIVIARHTAYWLLRRCDRSLPEIGRMFGVHHTTVLHGANRVERNPEALRIARLIYKSLTEGDDDA